MNGPSPRDELPPLTGMTTEELLTESSIGGEVDPELDHVCTDEEAKAAVARMFSASSFGSPSARQTYTPPPEGLVPQILDRLRRRRP